MLQSMTGYGAYTKQIGNRDFSFEIKGVNSRYLDIRVYLPRDYYRLENEIKEQISKYVNRGKVDLYINIVALPDTNVEVVINENLFLEYYGKVNNAMDLVDNKQDINIDYILSQPDVLVTKELEINVEEEKEDILQAIGLACEEFVEMRTREADSLVVSIKEQLEEIQKQNEVIAKRAETVVDEYRVKLEARIEELLPDNVEVDQDKLSNEIAYFADKAGVDEELVRIDSHVEQFIFNLNESGKIGRKLDFLIQELNREINTVGSKSSDIIITNAVVELKSVIEEIREQVQNLE